MPNFTITEEYLKTEEAQYRIQLTPKIRESLYISLKLTIITERITSSERIFKKKITT